MRFNIQLKKTIFAGAVALVVAPPVALGQGTAAPVQDQGQGTWQGNIHQDPGGTTDAPAPRHSRKIENKTPQSSSGASVPNRGTWQGGMHQDAGGTPDAPAPQHSPEVMKKGPQSSSGSTREERPSQGR